MKKIISLMGLLVLIISCNNSKPENEAILLSDLENESSCVMLTKDANGTPAVSWVEIESTGHKYFYFSLWNADNKSFEKKINIPIPQNTSIHEEGMPKIVFLGDGTILATFETSTPVPGTRWGKGDIEFATSKDKGGSWSNPVSVQAGYPFEGSIGFSNIIRLDDGQAGISWLGTNPGDKGGRPVMFARTDKDGQFSKALLIDSVACECCRIALSTNGAGVIKIAFRDLLPSEIRDISIAESDNNGESFSHPYTFSGDDWIIDGCPHDGPALVSRADQSFAGWYAGSSLHESEGVYYAELSKDNKTTVKKKLATTGKFIQLCLMPDGTRIAAYNERYKESDSDYYKIMVAKINDKDILVKEITGAHSHGFFPTVAPSDDNHVIVSWKDNNRIFYRRVDISEITDELIELVKPLAFNTLLSQKIRVTNETDPVCGMRLKKQMGKDTILYQEKIIGFCSPGCKERFRK